MTNPIPSAAVRLCASAVILLAAAVAQAETWHWTLQTHGEPAAWLSPEPPIPNPQSPIPLLWSTELAAVELEVLPNYWVDATPIMLSGTNWPHVAIQIESQSGDNASALMAVLWQGLDADGRLRVETYDLHLGQFATWPVLGARLSGSTSAMPVGEPPVAVMLIGAVWIVGILALRRRTAVSTPPWP